MTWTAHFSSLIYITEKHVLSSMFIMMDKDGQGDNRYLPQMGRARELIAVWEQTRWQKEMQQRRRGIWSPTNPIVGHGRAETLVLLREAANRNAVWPPNPIPCQRRGRGLRSFLLPQWRGLGSLFPPHAHPQLEPSTVGMGRARSRNPWSSPKSWSSPACPQF